MAEKDKPQQGGEGELVPEAVRVATAPAQRLWPLVLVLLLGVPLCCYLMIDFLVLPKLVAAVGAPASSPAASADPAATSSPTQASAPHGAAGKEMTVDFGKITVNVAGSGDNRYLRINLVFGSNNPGIKELIKVNDVALRDATITVLSSQSLANLEGVDARETTRRALISRVNGILGGPVVSQIYFTEFVIQ